MRKHVADEANSGGEAEASVAPERLYPAWQLYCHLGWKAAAQRRARNLGLAVKYFGGRSYILGSDAIEFLLEHGKEEKDA